MGVNKKKSRKKSKKVKTVELDNDIIGISILALGIIILFSLFSTRMGIVGQIINGTTFSLMGFGGYFFPFLIFGTGLVFILNRFKQTEYKAIISLIIIFISFLIILDGSNLDDVGLIERIKNGILLSKVNKGGGFIGSLFGFFFYKLFGSIGTYIVLSVLISISILVVSNIKVKDVLTKVTDLKPEIVYKEKPKKSKTIKKEKISPDELLEIPPIQTNVEEGIIINDYTTNESEDISKDQAKIKLNNQQVNEGTNNIETEIKEKQTKLTNLEYKLPPLNLLKSQAYKQDGSDKKDILNNAKIIEETMKNFGIEATISNINKGPTITCYELEPAPGIKLSRIVSLSDNIALSLATSDIRIEAPIPGKAAVGIEVPNKAKDSVMLKEILLSEEFIKINSNLPLALGKDVSGKPIVSSIDKMPHLLIAGATGSGKSVCINTIIMNILYKSSPDDVKLMLIDPKVVELSIYNGIPHLLIPVVTDAKKASFALNWAVTEMERRYKLFAQSSVRDITSYNAKHHDNQEERLPKVVIVIDELADLMMVAAQEIEDYICRLAQMARAAGMYLIVATQRPSVDVITGTIKANIPSRISFAVSSQVDSRTILDMAGAEKLLGKGDMLFFPSFYSKPVRIQGAFISDDEVENVVNYLKEQNESNYDEDIIEVIQNAKEINYQDSDELLPDAIKLVVEEGQASISLIQRKLRVGYARAARIVDEMEERGVIGGYEGSKPRKVLMTKDELEEVEQEI
ncbi:DNA translocase FtsK [Tissierella sp. Yu-01]|uniref:FtsK/SpoIIIE family DNA translocase n=1 Tax=Tissierella sp. Yu-01 TaxID=3035694 RepID=UPI00240D9079|nr:DNA translocase FtsK [Tissierella sp. Yu-01]WFA09750.1 DNA translocase FtsK 4TM domain-containing protein [Tissierella sp. Yu-01]